MHPSGIKDQGLTGSAAGGRPSVLLELVQPNMSGELSIPITPSKTLSRRIFRPVEIAQSRCLISPES